jgi:DegV family protein with EDD domain
MRRIEMDKKVLILTGDNLGLKNEQIDYPDVAVVKYPVVIGEKEYFEDEKYTAQYLIDLFKKEKIMARSQALIRKDIVEVIEKNKDKYDLIVHVIMGSNMSSATVQMAEMVRKEYKGTIPIINIDTKQTSSGVGAVLLRVIELLKEANSIDEFVSHIDEVVENTYTYFCVPDLNYLYRGGRIGRAQSLLGSVLRIIPVVGLLGEEANLGMLPIGKGRTYQAANKIIINHIKQKMAQKKIDRIQLINILHFENNDAVELKDLENQINNNLIYRRLVHGHARFVEAVHGGPGVWAASFVLK